MSKDVVRRVGLDGMIFYITETKKFKSEISSKKG
jgi:hypothetical protein